MSLCMFVIAHSMLVILSSVALCIIFNLSCSLFAISATAATCFTSKAAVKVVSWEASSKIVPVGSWTTWLFSFLAFLALVCSFFSLLSMLPFTSARGTRRFLPVFETKDLSVWRFGFHVATFSCPASTPSFCGF